MKVFTLSEARNDFLKLFKIAQREEVEIHRKDGVVFSLVSKRKQAKSPFDIPGIKTKASTKDILLAVRESRSEQPGRLR